MDKITSLLESIQIEQKLQKEEMREMQKNITKSINNNINEKFNEMDLKYKHLVEKLDIQEKQIDYLERENKRRNLVFFGIEEEERSYFQLYTKVTYIITMNMKLSCEKYDIENIKRIGKKGNKVRPVIVTLTTLGKKIEILKNKKSLASTSYYIQEDYPKKVLETRKSLKVTVEELRQEGKAAIIKYDKLIILEDKLPKQHQQSKKRMLTPSPVTQNNAKYKKNREQNKLSRSDIASFFVPQTDNEKPSQVSDSRNH